jgi:hypothetical protein
LDAVPDADLTEAVTEAALRLISASRTGTIEGVDVARELGRDPDDVDLYSAFKEAVRRGDLEAYFPGGMGMPHLVRLPAGR